MASNNFALEPEPGVQVRSSDPQGEQQTPAVEIADAETEDDEEDLDAHASPFQAANAPTDLETPATAVEGEEIQETPVRPQTATINGDYDAPFSTAQEVPNDPDSPLKKKMNDLQASNPALSTERARTASPEPRESAVHQPTNGTTSDPFDEHTTAEEVSRRTTGASKLKSQKRSLSAVTAEGNGDNASPATQGLGSKRTKVGASQTEDDETHDEGSPKKLSCVKQAAKDEIVVASASTSATPPASTSASGKGRAKESLKKATRSPEVRIPHTAASASVSDSKTPRVLFSKSVLSSDKSLSLFFKRHGSVIVEDVPKASIHFVCVVPKGELATTAKILRTLAQGKVVVTEEWVRMSVKADQLLDPDSFVHSNIRNLGADRPNLLSGKTLWFTRKLVKEYGAGWSSINDLGKDAGARNVYGGKAHDGEMRDREKNVIFFGSEDDVDVRELMKEHGKVVYHKDMLSQSILRGELDLESDEFRLDAPATPVKKGRGGKAKRQSV